jgi:hypothetical protein
MAPPIPGLRPVVQVRQRTAGDVLLGIAAVVALTALTIGVPVALISVFGVPIPHHFSTDFLTHQLDFMSVMRTLAVVIWILWIQLVWCVLVEIRAAVRNVGVPGRVPLAGATQSAAHRLVTAALLLFSATAALAPALSHVGASARPVHSVTAHANPGAVTNAPQELAGPQTAHMPVHASPTEEKIYVVNPPVGRFHESLWEIAQKHLGDGRRYREIFEMNKDRLQPDGTRLTIASLIRPGWVLRMPSDAHGPGIKTITEHEATHHAAVEAANVHGQSAISSDVGSGFIDGGAGAAPAQNQTGGMVWPYELSAASLLAAGVLSALGQRRRQRIWQRAFGSRLAEPEGAAAVAEKALRVGADDPAVRLLDTGLRQLAVAMAAQKRTPPTVYAAHLGEENLDLWVAPPDPNPPAPWTAQDNGQVWRLPAEVAAKLNPREAPAPYPGMVSIGTDRAGRVLVDLEVASGLIAVRGAEGKVRDALSALAVELVTNRWSDRMEVTLVGFGEGLTLLAPSRVRSVRTVDEILPELERRAAQCTMALKSSGFDSVLTGRTAGNPDDWSPHYVIVGVPMTQAQSDRLRVLARQRYRMAAGYVVAGDVAGATWTWDLSEDGRLHAGTLGFDVEAQLLPPEQYQAMIDLFRQVTEGDGPPLSDPSIGAAAPEFLVPGSRAVVDIGILGSPEVGAPGTIDAERVPLATEIAIYLAAHPEGVHLNVLTGAIWPRGVTPEVRDSALARVTAWLGGEENLVREADGRIALGPGVRVDWGMFRALIARAAEAGNAPESDGAAKVEMDALSAALDLVRGPLLDGHDPARYVWLGTDPVAYEVQALVADAAHRLSALRYSAGDSEGAMAAARAGLRLADGDQQLWRDLLIAAYATGSEPVLRGAVNEVCTQVASDEVLPKMAPETEALIDELYPAWRSHAA